MQSRSCTICTATVTDGIAVCCDRFVCPQKCLVDLQKNSSTCDSCNIMPSSLLPPSNLVSDCVSSSLASEDVADLKQIHFQQTLLALISSHLVRTLWKSDVACERSLRRLMDILPPVHHIVGYVSQRFLESTLLGVKLFLESTNIGTSSAELSLLLPIACYFQADVPSVSLIVDPSCEVEELLDHTSRITSLEISDDVTNLTHLLDSSSPLFLPRLSCIDFTTDSELTTFCETLLLSTTIVELSVTVEDISTSDMIALTEVFRSIHSFRRIKLEFSYVSPTDETLLLFTALASNASLKSLDLSGIFMDDLNVLVPLLNTSSLRSLVFPRCDSLDSTVIHAFKYNLSLQEISFVESDINPDCLFQVLKNNTSLKKLKISECEFEHYRNFLQSSTSLLDLSITVSTSRKELDGKPAKSLIKMVQMTSGLVSLSLGASLFKFHQLLIFLKALEANSTLQKVSFPGIILKLPSLISVFKILSPLKLRSTVDISPYFIDTQKAVFCYSPREPVRLTSEEVSSLQSFLDRFSIKQLTLENCRFTDGAIFALCRLVKINNSLISIDFSSCDFTNANIIMIVHALQLNSGLKRLFLIIFVMNLVRFYLFLNALPVINHQY
ncbi:hypothetical protein GEMRC1_009611 [Eukaryota sp. GEM-RC1]